MKFAHYSTGEWQLVKPFWSFDAWKFYKMCKENICERNKRTHTHTKWVIEVNYKIRDSTRFIGLVNIFIYLIKWVLNVY